MKIQPPRIPPQLDPLPDGQARFEDEAYIAQGLLAAIDLHDTRATAVHLEALRIERCGFTGAQLERLNAEDIIWRGCDLSAVQCSESSLFRMHVDGGRLSGIDLSRSTLRDVCFEDCKLDMANFRFAKLQRVTFRNCQLRETDFQAAELIDVTFPGSVLDKAIFDQCNLIRVDFRGALLYDLRGWQSLAGVKLDTTQLMQVAPQLALAMRLDIEP